MGHLLCNQERGHTEGRYLGEMQINKQYPYDISGKVYRMTPRLNNCLRSGNIYSLGKIKRRIKTYGLTSLLSYINFGPKRMQEFLDVFGKEVQEIISKDEYITAKEQYSDRVSRMQINNITSRELKIIRVEYGNQVLVSDAIRKLRGEPGIFMDQTKVVSMKIPLTQEAVYEEDNK